MNELLSDVRFWIVTVGGGVLAAFWRIVNYLWAKQEKRIDKLEADTVRRREFDELKADFQSKHVENSKRLDTGFSRIEELMCDDRNAADVQREKVNTSLEHLRTDVAVLKAEGLFDDAGRVRR